MGKSIRLKCPIHGGNSPTLSVDSETGVWQCFSCGAKGGSVLDFEMQHTGHGFVRAATDLGAWVTDGKDPSKTDKTGPRMDARAALRLLSWETVVMAQESARLVDGRDVTAADVDRMLKAAGRIQKLACDLGLWKIREPK